MDAQARKQPVPDKCAEDSNDDIPYDPKSGASDDLAGEPSGNEANDQYDDETFI